MSRSCHLIPVHRWLGVDPGCGTQREKPIEGGSRNRHRPAPNRFKHGPCPQHTSKQTQRHLMQHRSSIRQGMVPQMPILVRALIPLTISCSRLPHQLSPLNLLPTSKQQGKWASQTSFDTLHGFFRTGYSHAKQQALKPFSASIIRCECACAS